MQKRLFVTGMASFVGSRLVELAQSEGWDVAGLDSLPFDGGNCVVHDVTADFSELIPVGSVVVHLAALSTDGQCLEQPALAARVNIQGTVVALLSAQAAQASQFIFASTEWVYGRQPEEGELLEDAGPAWLSLNSLYATTKAVGEEICRGFAGHLPVSILRFGIVYGRRPNNWCAFESVVQQATTGVVSVGSAATSRRFIHVDDICRAILAAADAKPDGVNIWNVAGDQSITLGSIAETAGRLLGRPVLVQEANPESPSHRMPDSAKLKHDLHWTCRTDLESGVADVLEYLRELT